MVAAPQPVAGAEVTSGAAFVTGGSGTLGRPIVRALVAQGRPVVALARSDTARASLQELGARPVSGDVRDESSLLDGMSGCDVVFHVAGVNAFCLADPSILYRVNVEGSRAVIRASARAGVKRVVYTSSAAVVGEAAGTVGREDSPHRGWFLSHYERSKFEAERAVLTAAAQTDVDVVCLNPSSVQGPGRASGTARLIRAHLDGKLRVFVDSTVSFVDIDDCARGHLLAEERARPAERYLLNGATLQTRDALSIIGEAAGIERKARALPGSVAQVAAAAVEIAGRARGRTPPVCREIVRTLRHGHRYDGSKAARELGLAYTEPGVTLRRTVEWLVHEGLVARRPRVA